MKHVMIHTELAEYVEYAKSLGIGNQVLNQRPRRKLGISHEIRL